jgi:uncharacterized protein (DUF1919 family)
MKTSNGKTSPRTTPVARSRSIEKAKKAKEKNKARIMNGSLELKFVASANEELIKTMQAALTEELANFADT